MHTCDTHSVEESGCLLGPTFTPNAIRVTGGRGGRPEQSCHDEPRSSLGINFPFIKNTLICMINMS